MKNTLVILTLSALAMALSSSQEAQAQMPIKMDLAGQLPPDSLDLEHYGEKHFWRATGTVVGFNLGLWGFDRLVDSDDCYHITLKTMTRNLTHGFRFDNDALGTNMFLHPYTGNLYFNVGRSNGYNFWQSSLFAIGGSLMWEEFMENEYPSTNDIIATPVGGAAIGEVTYRISDTMLDDRSGGFQRVAREAGVFLLDPMRGLTRLMTGDMWRHRATTGRQFGVPSVGVQVEGGIRVMEYAHNGEKASRVGGTLGITMEYGDRFEVHSTKPYDYFTMHAGLNFITRQPLLYRFNIQGRLLAKELLDRYPQDLSLGLYQDFDYYDSDTISSVLKKCPFKLGVPASVGVGLMYRDRVNEKLVFDADLHVNAVILGGILTDYYNVEDRNYNLASGFSIKGGTQLTIGGDKLNVSLTHQLFRMYTWKGYKPGTNLRTVNPITLNVMGDKSSATFGMTELKAQCRLWRKLYLGLEFSHIFRHTKYKYHPVVGSSVFQQSLMLIYKL